MNVLETATQALALGFQPVLIRKGTKKPVHEAWQTIIYETNADLIVFDWVNAAVGLRWGLGFVDVDLEDINPLLSKAADFLLPATTMMWGRIRNERSHRVYACEEIGHKTIKITGIDNKGLAEIRGDRQQSVIPPSPWYNKLTKAAEGEYQWSDSRGPLARSDVRGAHGLPVIAITELSVMVKEAVFAAELARLWPEMAGSRHDAMIGISGMLLKGGRDAERVALICRVIVELGQDPDPGDRLQIPRTTATRLGVGDVVAGYTMVEAALGAEVAEWVAKVFHLPVERLTDVGGITLNDQGNSELYARLYSPDLMYLTSRKDWCGWDGRRWDTEPGRLWEQTKARALVKHLEALAPTLATPTERQAMKVHALRAGSANAMAAMVKLSRDLMRGGFERFDESPWLFNCLNGTVDLRTGDMKDHDRNDQITKICNLEYDPEAECPKWLKFLWITFEGNQRLIDFLQRWSGYMLTGLTREQCLLFCHGGGENGKSTFINTLAAIWGEYGLRSTVETVMKKKGDGGIPNDIARLNGARLVVTQEIGEGMRFAEQVIKDMTGDDVKTGRFLHGEFFDFTPILKLVLYGNHKPIITGTDPGIWRRIRLLPFLHTIGDDEKVKGLRDILTKEEAPGILRWCVEGCLKYQVSGLMEPPEVLEATAAYREQMDVLGEFFDTYFVSTGNEGDKVSMDFLYRKYQGWCLETGEREMPQRKLNEKMVDRGFAKYKSHGKWWLTGMTEAPIVPVAEQVRET